MFYLSNTRNLDSIYQSLHLSPDRVSNMSDEDFRKIAEQAGALTDLFMSDYVTRHAIHLFYYTYKEDCPDSTLVGADVSPEDFLYYVTPSRTAHYYKASIAMHRHDSYELLFVLDGSVYQNIEQHRHIYTKGCACLMNKNVYHKEEYTDYSRVVFMQLSTDFIMSILHNMIVFPNMNDPIYKAISDFFYSDTAPVHTADKSYIDFIPVNDLSADDVTGSIIYRLFDRISLLLQEKTAVSSIQISASVVELLYTLFNTCYYTTTPIRIGNENQRQLFDRMESYIHSRRGNVSRTDLEKEFNYSGDYIYRIILKYTGLSISNYTLQIRMFYAAKCIKETGMTIQEIALFLGFSNKTQFYNKFKEIYGMTPKEYKKSGRN